MDQVIQQFETLLQNDWVVLVLTVIVILLATFLVSRIITKFLRVLLLSNDNQFLPANSIFINIARGTIWVIGICIILATCFNVNVNAVVAALGVGGIAVSLGFQDTISNLIGGLQMSLMNIIKPGDNIEVGEDSGVVKDVTWRHTTITNTKGETIIIPNSTINKTALIKLPPSNQIGLMFVVRSSGADLDEVAKEIEEACAKAVEGISKISQKPRVYFSEVTDFGFRGKVVFRITSSSHVSEASDAALRAIAPLTRPGEKGETTE